VVENTEGGVPVIAPTVGELLNSCALVYIFNGITKFSSQWFGEKGRVLATALQLAAFYLGYYFLNWILIPFPIEGDSSIKFVEGYWYGVAIFSFCMIFVVAIFFPDKPVDCPTKS
jgi:hypothetical protein